MRYAMMKNTTNWRPAVRHKRSQNLLVVYTLADEVMAVVDSLISASIELVVVNQFDLTACLERHHILILVTAALPSRRIGYRVPHSDGWTLHHCSGRR